MSALAMNPVDGREVVKCECGLTQFRTANGQCRRCHAPFETAAPEPEPVPESRLLRRGGKLAVMGVAANVPTAFSRLFRMVREAQGMSQADLGRRLKLPRTYVSKIENLKCVPTVKQIPRLCLGLGVDQRRFMEAVEIGAR